MFASAAKLKAGASASLVVRINKISITFTTGHFDQIGLNLDLERILFEFHKLATTLVDAQWVLEIERLTFAPLDIGMSLVTIHQVDMIGLLILNIPNSSFLHGNHNDLEKDAGLDRLSKQGCPHNPY
jgi:hypothetical protein